MRTTVDGIVIIALGYNFNSKKTLFFAFPEGCAPTTAGEPYITKWPDEDGNVLSREVDRPAAPARFFGVFNKADTHDRGRQHELALEAAWIGKDEVAGKFRVYTSTEGMLVVDTQLAVTAHSHPGHEVRSMTTKDFAERLAEELVDNKLDGDLSRPNIRRKRPVTAAAISSLPVEGPVHVLKSMGRYSDVRRLKEGERDALIQIACDVCTKRCSTYCTATQCNRAPVCSTHKRRCLERHKGGESKLGQLVSGGGEVKRRRSGPSSEWFPV